MNNTLLNGFNDLEVPVVDGGTNDTTTLSLTFNGEDQGAKGTITPSGTAGAITAWVKVNDASRDETFRLRPRTSGYKALPAGITIDGVTVQPSILLQADNATVSAWTDTVNGNSFAITGSGSDPTLDELSPGIDCKRVKFNGGKRYEAASNSVGAVGTNDFVVEFIISGIATGVHYAINRRGAAGDSEAIIFYISSSGLIAYIAGSALTASIPLAALSADAVYHAIIFFDRSGNAKGYVNGVASSAVSISALSAVDLAASVKWNLGAAGNGGTSPFTGGLSYFALWARANWLSTADYAGIAAERFARCCGVYPEIAQAVNPGFFDLDTEAADAVAWASLNGATLSKQSGARTGGSGSLVLRIAGDGSTASPKASQTRAGGITRITGWARSNGTAVPTVALTGTTIWTGSNSTSWQSFDIAVPDYLYASTRLELGTALATGHVEFDDLSLETSGYIPAIRTRASIAYLEKWNIAETEAYLIPVGVNWARTDKIKCADGAFKTGARIENQQTNRFLYSEDFSNAAWTKTRTTLGTSITGLGVLTFNALVASVDNATHLVTQAITTAAGEDHAVTVYAKSGAVNSIKIELNEDSTQYAYYNLSTGAVGATGGGFALSQPAQIYDKGNGFYRCEFRPRTAGVTATINIYLSNGSTAGSETFAGNGSTISAYLSAAQFERYASSLQQRGSATSYVKTTTATATRTGDALTFNGYENCGGRYTKNVNAKVSYVCPVYGSGYTGYRLFGALTNRNASNRAELIRDVTQNKLYCLVTVGGTTQASLFSATSVNFDNNEQIAECCLAKDNINIIINRLSNASDTSADIPEMLEIVIGASVSYQYHLDGIITDFALSPCGVIYPRAVFALDSGSYSQSAFVGYDPLDADGLTYELRAGAGTGRGVTMNGGTLNAGQWYLVSLEWAGGTAVSLKVNGVEVDSATADASLAVLADLFIAWCYSREI